MGTSEVGSVRCRDGLRGVLEPSGPGVSSRVIRLDDGRRVVVASSLLKEDAGGGYDLPIGLAEVDRLCSASAAGEVVIPLTEETAEVSTRRVETGRVKVSKTVTERSEVIDLPLNRETVDVERVAVNRVVDGPVETRREGDTLIVPILEEVLHVEKRLLLREEVRITTRRTEAREPQTVTLRREDALVERSGP
jgi:uncharacterized protein (TIGR02271 family)